MCPSMRNSEVDCAPCGDLLGCTQRMTTETDLHIYQGGVALQQFFIFVFLAASVKFHRTFARESPTGKKAQALALLYTVYAVLALITVCTSLSETWTPVLWIQLTKSVDPNLVPYCRILQRSDKLNPQP